MRTGDYVVKDSLCFLQRLTIWDHFFDFVIKVALSLCCREPYRSR